MLEPLKPTPASGMGCTERIGYQKRLDLLFRGPSRQDGSQASSTVVARRPTCCAVASVRTQTTKR